MSMRLRDTLSGELRPLEPLEARARPDLQLRPDGLRPGPHRQLPVVPVRRPPRPLPALPRAQGHLGDEHHRHRRQDHPRRGRGEAMTIGELDRTAGSSASWPTRGAAHDAARRPAARDRAHRRDGRPHRDAAREGPRLPDRRRLDLLPDRSWPAYGRLARLDPEQLRVGERVEADEYGKDDVRDFALWKGPKPGEPSWDTPIGAGPAGLAHRVLGDEHEAPRRSRSTSTPAASTSSSRTTRTRSPRARPRPASPSSGPGSTAPTCGWAARRWPSRVGNIARVADLLERASRRAPSATP